MTIIDELYKEIPEYYAYVLRCIDEEFHQNGYLIFGPFGVFLTDEIIKNGSQELIHRCYNFANRMCINADADTQQMLKVTFFEHFTDFKKSIEMSRLNFKGNALSLFEDVLNGPIFGGGLNAK